MPVQKGDENANTPIQAQSIVTTDEHCVFEIRASLYRFDGKVDNEWKERGTGDFRIFRRRSNNSVRVVMHRDKTLTVCANHVLAADMKLTRHEDSELFFVYHCLSDVTPGFEPEVTFGVRVTSKEDAEAFQAAFNKGVQKVFTDDDNVSMYRSYRGRMRISLLETSKDHESSTAPEEEELECQAVTTKLTTLAVE